MQIYQLPVSLYSFKLRLVLRLKGLTIPLVEPPGGTYRSADYRAINPAGSIPALVDGPFVLAESEAIIEYLEDLGVGSPLYPADLRMRAKSRMLSRWHDFRLEPAVHSLFAHVSRETRNAGVVEEANTRIGDALTLIESCLDGAGPFALGERPTGVDCALAASLVWIEVFTPVFGLRLPPHPRALRGLAALSNDPKTTNEMADYRALATTWTAQRG
ncbi:Gst Glutathione S-transferase [Rhabdaerophilaceae bacterium]